MADDPVDAFLRRLLEMAPQTSTTFADELERTLRQQIGGGRYYIRQAPGVEKKTFRLGAAIAAGFSVRQAAHAVGVSVPAAYRLARRRWVIR